MRRGVAGAVLALTVLLGSVLSACSDDAPAPAEASASADLPIPAYDPTLPPSEAALALVPEDARTLVVTDFARIQESLGASVTSASPPAEQAAFWRRAEREAPMLSLGLLRDVDELLRSRYGFGRSDVEWEARFHGGGARGWALKLREGTAMAQVEAAVRAGVGPLRGASVRPGLGLVTRGTAEPGQRNWAADPTYRDLLGPMPSATYVHRGCLPGDTGPTRLEELDAYAVDLGGSLATVRLGTGRGDVSARVDLASGLPAFARVLTHPVGDPSSGRIGFRMTDPVAAVDLVLTRRIPVAVCAG